MMGRLFLDVGQGVTGLAIGAVRRIGIGAGFTLCCLRLGGFVASLFNACLRDGDISEAIIQGYGIATLDNIKKILVNIAVGDIPVEKGAGKFLTWMRTGSSIAAMGASMTTTLLQHVQLHPNEEVVLRWVPCAIRPRSLFLTDCIRDFVFTD